MNSLIEFFNRSWSKGLSGVDYRLFKKNKALVNMLTQMNGQKETYLFYFRRQAVDISVTTALKHWLETRFWNQSVCTQVNTEVSTVVKPYSRPREKRRLSSARIPIKSKQQFDIACRYVRSCESVIHGWSCSFPAMSQSSCEHTK